jgi:hypothetical protein
MGISVAASYLAGRYSAPEKIKTVTKVEVHEVTKTVTEKSGEKNEVITQIKKPDGTEITRTRIEAHHESRQAIAKEAQTKTEVVHEVTYRQGVVISALIGLPLSSLYSGAVYGVAVSKPFIGPIHLGVWGMSDKTIGLSAGLEF